MSTYTITTDAAAGAAQTIAAETWGYQPGVTQGRVCEISTTSRTAAYLLSRTLRSRGYRASVSR